ncbi:MAG: histidine--tRNA ligase [Patescibacteria group bacterium]
MPKTTKKAAPKTAVAEQVVKLKIPKTKGQLQLVRGMRDILPNEQPYWQFVVRKCEHMAEVYGYDRIDTPIVEHTSLFVRAVGEATDIVEKEMYAFQDKSGEYIALRPELTAGIARAYVEHGMVNQPQPVKLFSWGPFFRHDRPQAGRYRQAHHFGAEIIGSAEPILDAELISIAYHLYQELGLDVVVQVNSIGDAACRPAYRGQLMEYYKKHKRELCEDCKRRLAKNPLRLLDCKVDHCKELAQNAPQTIDHLCEECKTHFTQVLEYLDSAEIVYQLNPRIVRGLDYYTRTAFEFALPGENGEPGMALGGGGRYDGLLASLGAREATPAVGFGLGIERIILAMKERNVPMLLPPRPDVFFAQIGASARKRSLKILEDLRKAGFRVRANLTREALGPQLGLADRYGARFALILGQKEIIDETILLREMLTGSQEVIDIEKMIPELKKRLDKLGPDTEQRMVTPMQEAGDPNAQPGEDGEGFKPPVEDVADEKKGK